MDVVDQDVKNHDLVIGNISQLRITHRFAAVFCSVQVRGGMPDTGFPVERHDSSPQRSIDAAGHRFQRPFGGRSAPSS